ncbi:MAG: hypothetical protein Q8Q09_05470 [Deltaproteobacteria bacterium]|nr:hypothetical protein [Deltaproteobacteria bacterium]
MTPSIAPATVRSNARTMMGVMLPPGALEALQQPAATPPPAAQPAPTASTGPASVKNANRTMLGVSLDAQAIQALAEKSAKKTDDAMHNVDAPTKHPIAVPNASHTMIGVQLTPPPGAVPMDLMSAAPKSAPAAVSATGPAHAQGWGAPIAPATSAPVSSANIQHSSSPAPMGSDSFSDFAIPGLNTSKSRGSGQAKRIAAVVLAAVVVGGGVLLALSLRKGALAPLVATAESANGERTLVIQVPNAPAQSRLRYTGGEVAIEANSARLPGSVLNDRVGRVELPVQMVSGGTVTARTAVIVVAYLVQADLEGLAQDPPVARLRIRVQPGATVTLDGQPVQVDAQGQGIAAVADVRALRASEPELHHNFAIHVQNPDRSSADGTYGFALTRAPLQIDRPTGERWQTSAPQLLVRVRAAGASAVQIQGAEATREGEVFSRLVPLAEGPASALTVRAMRPGFAPALGEIQVERLADTAAGVRAFAPVGDAPCGEGLLGKKLSVSGRVLAEPREHNGGVSFQLAVSDRRCPDRIAPLWVDAEPGTATQAGRTLRVTGVITSTRTSVSASGDRRTDPVLHAAFVGR